MFEIKMGAFLKINWSSTERAGLHRERPVLQSAPQVFAGK
jgi:hypothetical protein